MDKFYIITNSDKDKNLTITGMITEYLKSHESARYSWPAES